MPFAVAATAAVAQTAGGMYAANQGAKAQEQATGQAHQDLVEGRDMANSVLQPYRDLGPQYLSKINNLMTDPSYLTNTAGYKFRMDQAQNGKLRSLASARGIFGGGALKELDQFNQGYASNEYQNEFNRLAQMATMGQNAATATANSDVGAGSSLANVSLQQGQNQADMYANYNNALQGGLQNMMFASYMNGKR